MKMNINDVLCQKTSPIWLHFCVHCPPRRAAARQIILEGCFNEKLHHKKTKAL